MLTGASLIFKFSSSFFGVVFLSRFCYCIVLFLFTQVGLCCFFNKIIVVYCIVLCCIPEELGRKRKTSLVKQNVTVFTVRRYALHGLCDRNSVRPSVRLSVRLSVTLVHCVHTDRPMIMISSPYGSPIILVSGDITFIPKFEGGHPERGR